MIKNLATTRVIYVSSYIPRRCGIATYTKDLTNAINLLNPRALAEIIAVNRNEEKLTYPKEVKFIINHHVQKSYVQAADYINQSEASLVSFQHEFGLFNAPCGSYTLSFIKALKLPFITTLHTIPDDPICDRGVVLKKIIEKSQAVIVMIKKGQQRLVNDYGILPKKIVVIPHGIPDLPYSPTEKFKRKKKLFGRIVLGNINLINWNYGIEYGLEAVSLIRQKFPQVLYLVIGQTHPARLQREGEAYRNFLKEKVRSLDIQDNVKFINKYLSWDELISWLKTIDIYVTPYLKPEQSASGALSYALGAGKFCVSTPYLYAQEVLSHNRGVFVPFRDSKAIAQKIIYYWQNPEQRQVIEKNAYKYGRLMTWPHVALQHLNLFKDT